MTDYKDMTPRQMIKAANEVATRDEGATPSEVRRLCDMMDETSRKLAQHWEELPEAPFPAILRARIRTLLDAQRAVREALVVEGQK